MIPGVLGGPERVAPPISITSQDTTPLSFQRTCCILKQTKDWVQRSCPLGGVHGPHTGTTHGYLLANRHQMVLLSIAAELPLEKHPALHDRD